VFFFFSKALFCPISPFPLPDLQMAVPRRVAVFLLFCPNGHKLSQFSLHCEYNPCDFHAHHTLLWFPSPTRFGLFHSAFSPSTPTDLSPPPPAHFSRPPSQVYRRGPSSCLPAIALVFFWRSSDVFFFFGVSFPRPRITLEGPAEGICPSGIPDGRFLSLQLRSFSLFLISLCSFFLL